MRYFLAAGLVALVLPAGAEAQSADIQDVIRSQLDAFLADDVVGAFAFASPGIRSMFGSPENFGRMVQQGYPMVWRPADVTWLGLDERDGRMVQRVQIEDAAGALHTLEYHMIQTAEGWKIDGVYMVKAPNPSV